MFPRSITYEGRNWQAEPSGLGHQVCVQSFTQIRFSRDGAQVFGLLARPADDLDQASDEELLDALDNAIKNPLRTFWQNAPRTHPMTREQLSSPVLSDGAEIYVWKSGGFAESSSLSGVRAPESMSSLAEGTLERPPCWTQSRCFWGHQVSLARQSLIITRVTMRRGFALAGL